MMQSPLEQSPTSATPTSPSPSVAPGTRPPMPARSQLAVPGTRPSQSSARSSPSTSSKLAKSMTKLGTAVYADGMHELADAHTLALASGTQLVHCLATLKAIEAKVGTAHDTVTDVHDTLTAVCKAGQLRMAAVALRRAVDKCDSASVVLVAGSDGGACGDGRASEGSR